MGSVRHTFPGLFPWLCLALGLSGSTPGWSSDTVPAGYRAIAAEVGTPFTLFYAIALTESGRRIEQGGVLRPWPWTLNILLSAPPDRCFF